MVGKTKLLTYIINTIKFINKLIIIRMEEVIKENLKELIAQSQLHSRF